ncbi:MULTISPECIES: TonB-dependent receptor [unclassified Arcicella]|uniref:SusC/RagA family TonB-linked outer membrane protein n=1 Tax=unclassified Arcicella TaxID=2644986 RepID=UPI00285E8A0E|nr:MULTISPECIES: TonB-dependent receptor [unclassified Arcicella]MDR6560809.1 TonB-linked SusC/RagA family outer membrane protein [Arcicella sp. BE51]MDR6810693.1 TonB-linked SusC/RagA family outer membrane protein [Arcicella sp. BE140]MDR6822043.1 TonB-linked SusC/RagA family outer membrane protein [Arcicella sp. BE139]
MNKKLLLSFVFLLALVFRVAAQDRTVTGKVTSAEDGSALPGVSVGVKGSTRGTVSAADGSYKINVSGNATLTFTFVGFKKAEIPAGTKSIVNVSLSSDVSDLEEVVVVGYGTQSRRTLTGSQASVKGSDIASIPVQTFDRALQGRAAGVQISGSNGVPGGQVQVRIRGVGSIKGGTDPLYVVDGVQINTTSSSVYASTNPLSYLNPNDIENIEILKDAASAAIYGAAAANGVVLVTTKKGKAGKTSITLDYNTGYVEPTKYLDVLNTQEWIKLRTEAIMNQTGSTEASARTSALTGVRLSGTLSDAEIAALPTYDWQKEAYQSGKTNNYNFSMNGGNDKTTFFLSGAYNQSDANVRNIDYKGGNFSAKINNKVSSHVSVDASINLSSFNQRGTFGGPNGGSFLGSPSFSSPLILPMNRIYNDDGSYFGTPADGGIAGVLNQNVLMVSDLNKINSRTNQLISSLGLTFKIIDGLTFRPYASLDYRTINGYNFQDPRTADAFNVKGRIASQQFELINFLTNATVMYDKVIKNDHKIGALVGVEYRQNTQENYQATAEGIPTPQFTTQSSAANPISVFSSWTGFKKAGVFTRLSYDYKNKYFLGLTARYDGSSRFGADNLYGFFPGVSAGWDISGEDFLKNNASVSQLKLRASYGTLGNDQIGNFDSRGLYGGGANYNGLSGISPSSLSNASLRWERNTTSNFALDYGFFNSRVQGSIEYFVRTSSDLLLDQPVPQTSGFSTISNNLGELQNKGLEFSIKTINVDRGGFKWTTDFNITKINNKITKLYDTLTTLPGRAVDEQIKIGQPLNSIYVAQYAGVNPATGRAMWYDNAGNIIYRLAGSVDSYSKIIGSQIPNLYGGFTNDFSYKGFDLNILFTYEYGRTAFNNQSSFMFENGGRTFNTLRSVYESRWTTPGQITSTPRPINGNAETLGSGITAGSRVYEDASYIRLKTVSLGYNIPKTALSKFGLASARVYVQGYNLYTWTKWSGFDAEWTNLGSGNTGIVPQPRVVTAGVKLGF